MKWKKYFICWLVLSLVFISAVFSPVVLAISGTVEANRFLYATKMTYNSDFGWTDPAVYNQYSTNTYSQVAAIQMNTYPGVTPAGNNVSINGKMNVSFLDRTGQYFPYVSELWDLTVVCGWGGQYLVTDGASVAATTGNWEGVLNNGVEDFYAKVTYVDLDFSWSGHFPNGYSSVSSDALLSCTIRTKTGQGSYYKPFAVGTLNNNYVYSSNASFNSYLSYSTSDDAIPNAVQGVKDAVVNLQNTLTEQNNQIIQNQQATTDAVNNLNTTIEEQQQQQQDQYDEEKQEESEREESGNEFADQMAGVFSFSIQNPFTALFGAFTSGNTCVNIPTIAAMINSDNTQYCPWFPASVRNVLTPVLSMFSMILIFGFIISWLNGNDANGSITIKGGIK